MLDVGCGTGQTTVELARRVGPSGDVTGLDISTPMLEGARKRAVAAGIDNVAFVQADAQTHGFEAGAFDFCWVMPHWREVVNAWLEFVIGRPLDARSERRFVTVLFTDIVGSTERARAVGDDAWRLTLESHDRIAWKTIDGHRGSVIKSTGDGLLVTFVGPSDAVACAVALRHELSGIGLAIRAGLHAGEVITRDDGDVGGFAVNLASRVAQAAQNEAIYVSSTVRDLLLGGDQTFADRGDHTLKGIDGSWHLYQLSQ